MALFRRRTYAAGGPGAYGGRPARPGLLSRLFGAVASLVWWILAIALVVIAVIIILSIL